MKKGKIGYDFTHCLKNGEVQYAKIMYFYLVEFDLNGENEITLPNDNDIVILAASQTNAPFSKLATPTYDEVEKRPFTFKLNFKRRNFSTYIISAYGSLVIRTILLRITIRVRIIKRGKYG